MAGRKSKRKTRLTRDEKFQTGSLSIEDEGRLWLWKLAEEVYIGVLPETEQIIRSSSACGVRQRQRMIEARMRRQRAGLDERVEHDGNKGDKRALRQLHEMQRALLIMPWGKGLVTGE